MITINPKSLAAAILAERTVDRIMQRKGITAKKAEARVVYGDLVDEVLAWAAKKGSSR